VGRGQAAGVCFAELGRETKTPVCGRGFRVVPRPAPKTRPEAQPLTVGASHKRAAFVQPPSAGGCDACARSSGPAPAPLPAVRAALRHLLQLRPRIPLRLTGVQRCGPPRAAPGGQAPPSADAPRAGKQCSPPAGVSSAPPAAPGRRRKGSVFRAAVRSWDAMARAAASPRGAGAWRAALGDRL
jgi:hypothetical protein